MKSLELWTLLYLKIVHRQEKRLISRVFVCKEKHRIRNMFQGLNTVLITLWPWNVCESNFNHFFICLITNEGPGPGPNAHTKFPAHGLYNSESQTSRNVCSWPLRFYCEFRNFILTSLNFKKDVSLNIAHRKVKLRLFEFSKVCTFQWTSLSPFGMYLKIIFADFKRRVC